MRRIAVGLFVAVGAVAVLAAVVWAGLTTTHRVIQPISFWVEDGRTIGVVVFNGSPRACRVAGVDESEGEVRISIECERAWLSTGGTAAIHRHWYIVELVGDLGARSVVDGNGRPARVCASDRCETEGPPVVVVP